VIRRHSIAAHALGQNDTKMHAINPHAMGPIELLRHLPSSSSFMHSPSCFVLATPIVLRSTDTVQLPPCAREVDGALYHAEYHLAYADDEDIEKKQL
jgi:hypothetical protein